MLWIGMISYSLYLVHWPAVSFWRYLTSQEWTALDQAGVILASLAAAAVMHRFVETPFRHMPAGGGGGRWKANRGFVAGCALVAGLGIAPGVAERFRIGHDWEDMSGIAAFQGMTGAPAMRQASVSVAGGCDVGAPLHRGGADVPRGAGRRQPCSGAEPWAGAVPAGHGGQSRRIDHAALPAACGRLCEVGTAG
jgi:hypothetical protein